MSASEQLESMAVKYANEAIQLDRQGLSAMAVKKYQRTIELLLKLCTLYPDAPQNKVYKERIEAYTRRIKYLNDNRWEQGDDSTTSSRSSANLGNLFMTEKPNVTWESIADLKEAKRAVEESIIYPTKRPDLFPLGWPRGILFYGPPGCGKTLLAAAIATEIDATFLLIDAASIMSKWLGESEKNVASLFRAAREVSAGGKPAIIFIDEVDSLVGIRSEEVGGEVRTRNQFLKEMDSVTDKSAVTHVYVIGATNKPWFLDEPFIRRFQKRIYVPLPSIEARTEIIRLYSKSLKLAPDFDPEQLARLTDGYSGSDLRDLFQAAQIKVVRELFESNREVTPSSARPLSMQDFLEVIKKRKPSVSKDMLRYYERWSEAFKAL